jgi:ligand-binding SRPBCC domain-containing protein
MSKTFSLKTVQQFPAQMPAVWDFFSQPANLKNITPSNLGFNIVSRHHGQQMYAGQIIEYTVKPILGIPLYWMTEITQVKDQQFFIDEQRYGPYSLWHHQHHFKAVANGVEMTDIVHYRLPLGLLGTLANGLFVQAQLRSIFDFRIKKAEELLGKVAGQPASLTFY